MLSINWGYTNNICYNILSHVRLCVLKQTASTTDPAKSRFHRPQHLKVVRETIPSADADLSVLASNGQV